ncbi:MAG TPA: tetratricopeptide repeat protein [Pyrinomonadaceae bacterium]|nr:tetratricopeptide repeat protein [Pyrinomonadaceae bacterium]
MKRKSPVAFLPVAFLAALAASAVSAQSGSPAAPTVDDVAQQAIASADLSKHRDLPIPPEGQKQYDLGVRFYDSAKFADAVAAFKEATRISPNDAQAFFMLGLSEARLQLYKESVESFKRAVRVRPDWAEAQFRLGIVSHVSGRKTLATEAYASLLRLNSPLANILFRVIREAGDRAEFAAQVNVGGEFWSYPYKPRTVENVVASPKPEQVATPAEPANAVPANTAPAVTVPANTSAVTEAALSNIYRIGVGDVLDIRLLNSITPRSTLYTVLEGGLIDFPVAGGSMLVAGLTADEVQQTIAAELKRRAVEEGARVTVGVRQYASHSVSITGLVGHPGTRFLRREAVPLYVIMAESQTRQDAGRVAIIRAGSEVVLDLAELASLNFLIKSGDLLNVTGRPQQFYYIGGKVNYPGQKVFQPGLTLLQAILAAGGAARPGDNVVEVSRDNGSGILGTTKFKVKEIKTGAVPDPKLQPGDRIEIVR